MTAAALRLHTAKDLAQMARQNGVAGWHSMRKEELVDALARIGRKRSSGPPGTDRRSAAASSKESRVSHTPRRTKRTPDPRIRRKIDQLQRKLAVAKNIASTAGGSSEQEPKADRLVVMVRDPLLVARLLGTNPGQRRSCPSLAGPALARVAPNIAGLLRQGDRRRGVGERHYDPWRGLQLVRRCTGSALRTPHGDWLRRRRRGILLSRT